MFLQSLRKIGTSATTRRRPARKCEVGIECLDTRAVPAIFVPTPGSPLLESGLGTLGSNVLNVSWDEHGHGVAQTTVINPFTGLASTTSRLLATNLNAAGVPQPIPGVDFGTTPGVPSSQTILVFGQSTSATAVTATSSDGATTLTATNVPVSITNAPGVPANTPAFLNLTATSTAPAVVDTATGHVTQSFTGTFSITSASGGAGQNYLSGTFSNTAFGNLGGTQLSLNISQPGTAGEKLAFTSTAGGTNGTGLPTDQPVAMTLSMTAVTSTTGGSGLTVTPGGTIGGFTSNVSGTFSATVTPPPTPTPTLAYKLPTPVADGDVAVYNFQTGQLSDLIRFQTVSDPVAGTTSWMLIYSDVSATNPADSPADVGVPTPTHSVLTQSAIEFGVEGYGIVEYAAEQANYSGLSDGNAIPFGQA